ncbi:DUF427 domain-containing protein [Roseomonas sp. CCTCC AB2023176]|uniref:DUF427 domain-containing protein n=1 Tax=Roseomonas sp. CCTCC AB2023176 TaxID=3342640 RepID=UPI0035E2A604
MARANWNGATIAEGADDVIVEGNVYFAPADVRTDNLRPSDHTSICPWKGTARYHHVVVDGQVNENAAWYYPDPKPAAAQIKDRIAFWKGVSVSR